MPLADLLGHGAVVLNRDLEQRSAKLLRDAIEACEQLLDVAGEWKEMERTLWHLAKAWTRAEHGDSDSWDQATYEVMSGRAEAACEASGVGVLGDLLFSFESSFEKHTGGGGWMSFLDARRNATVWLEGRS